MTVKMGAAYYPEHWEKERIGTDARLMREAGFNTARMAEFAWSMMEKRRGEYDFSWLDEAIGILGQEGVQTVLCTPTATPPKWICDEVDVYQRDAYGRPRGFGSRRHYCYNNPAYRVESARIIVAMAEHYNNHPDVIAWQIDNEFGCHDTTRCYCDHCLQAFKGWLQQKYQTIERLQQEWGLVFWSQTLNSFNDVFLPAYTAMENPNQRGYPHSPGLLLDFCRFSSDSAIAYQKFQLELLRDHGINVPITHNLMGHEPGVDYYKLSQDIDFVCWDNYPLFPFQKNDYRGDAMAHDLMRSVKKMNFWVMEHQVGPGGGCVVGDMPKPGQIRLWTYASLAHGAEGIIYFNWRACTFGTEQYWHGILHHDGIPRRRYEEVACIGREMQRIGHVFASGQNTAEVAIVKSYDNVWSQQFQWHSPQFNYDAFLKHYYNGLLDNQVNCDIIELQADFSPYKLVFLPAASVVNPAIVSQVEAYVRDGGTLVLTFRSGIKEWNNAITKQQLPGYFRDLAGIDLLEYDALNTDRENAFTGVFGEGAVRMWCDIIDAKQTEVLAAYSSDYYAGSPCIVKNRYGQGTVYYVGCDMDAAAQQRFTALVLDQAGIQRLNAAGHEGVELIQKMCGSERHIVLLNHGHAAVDLPLSFTGTELLSGQPAIGSWTLPAYGVAVIQVLEPAP